MYICIYVYMYICIYMYIFFFFHLAKFVDHVKGNKLTKH